MASRSLHKVISASAGLWLSMALGSSCSSQDDSPESVTPALLSVTPDKAVATGGTQVTIAGNGFLPGANVLFAGVSATSVSGQGGLLVATVPAYMGPLGLTEVRVHNPDGGEIARSDLFSYVRIPVEFARTLTRKVGKEPVAIAAADVNGDGGPELIIANRGDSTITVLLHNEDYQSTAGPYPTAATPNSIALADINGDGQKDVLVACNNSGGQDLSILRSSGNGSFIPPVNLAIGASASGVTASDFNGDGKIDVAVSLRASGKVYVLTNTSPGASVSFAQPYAGYDVGREPVGLLGYELSGDGRADIITANYRDNQLGMLLSTTSGTFQQPTQMMALGTGPVAVAAGELTSDQRPDIAAVNFDSNTVSILKAQGDGSFTKVTTLPTAEKPIAVAIADLDRDGKQDVIVANSGVNGISVFLGRGDGTFDPAQQFAVGTQPWALAVVDLDHDGLPDVATANQGSGDVSILFNRTAR